MADYIVTAEQVGAYEIPLTAGNSTTIAIENRAWYASNTIQVSVHDSSMPVYVRVGTKVSIKNPEASIVLTGTWLELRTPYAPDSNATVALISAADATISVARA